MAKKFRKTPPRRPERPLGRREPGPPGSDEGDDAEDQVDESTPASSRPEKASASTRVSPLAREQERELEIMMTGMGAVVGGLSGFSLTGMDATQGDPVAAVGGGLLGALLGLSLGRTLFLSVRTQWLIWAMLGLVTWAGMRLQGLWLAAGGVLVITAWLMFSFKDEEPEVRMMASQATGSTPSSGTAPEALPEKLAPEDMASLPPADEKPDRG